VSSTKKRIFALIAVAFFTWGGLNTTGFCFSEMRYVPDKEFFARYLESTSIWLQPQLIQVRGFTGDPNVKSFERFERGSDYVQKYPDCCSYGAQVGVLPDSDYPPSFLKRFFGLTWGLVALHYRLQYVNGAGEPKEHQWFGQGWVDSCGHRVWHY
jgi:hypothetical protein